tara:strand:+ start:636 stop:758 length:123 start_codon:yes stop_codon:yes gene_type:complete
LIIDNKGNYRSEKEVLLIEINEVDKHTILFDEQVADFVRK